MVDVKKDRVDSEVEELLQAKKTSWTDKLGVVLWPVLEGLFNSAMITIVISVTLLTLLSKAYGGWSLIPWWFRAWFVGWTAFVLMKRWLSVWTRAKKRVGLK